MYEDSSCSYVKIFEKLSAVLESIHDPKHATVCVQFTLPVTTPVITSVYAYLFEKKNTSFLISLINSDFVHLFCLVK